MKRPNSKATSAIVKTLASSMVLTSCSQNLDMEQLLDNSPSESEINDSKGVSISLSLNEETKQSLQKIAPLVQEIIDNPTIAQELSEDPNGFCKKRGYDFTFELDDAILKVIIALGNKDINDALKNNDFERFMQLCAELHLLDEGQKVRLNAVFQSEEEQEIFNSIAEQLNGESIESRSVALWLAVSVVIVIAIILTYTVGTEEDVAQNKPLMAQEECQSVKEAVKYPHIPRSQAFLRCTNPNYSVLDVWALKNKRVDSYQLVSGYKTFLAQQIVSYLKTNKPNLFKNFSEVQITEFLLKNMIV